MLYRSTVVIVHASILSFFFFNDTATTEIYTLSLHDALPISMPRTWLVRLFAITFTLSVRSFHVPATPGTDRKSTRLNSSHSQISYAVFCLKKKKTTEKHPTIKHASNQDVHPCTHTTSTVQSL